MISSVKFQTGTNELIVCLIFALVEASNLFCSQKCFERYPIPVSVLHLKTLPLLYDLYAKRLEAAVLQLRRGSVSRILCTYRTVSHQSALRLQSFQTLCAWRFKQAFPNNHPSFSFQIFSLKIGLYFLAMVQVPLFYLTLSCRI